jgi:prepilin-type N-terminal cleavage/methylation domain-containing protein
VRNQRGFTLIDLLFVIGLIGLLSSLAVPTLTRARGAAQASSALATVRVINAAQLSFAITCGRGFYAPDLPTLGIAPAGSPEAFLTEDLTAAASVTKSGYTFALAATPLPQAPGTCNGLADGLAATGYAVTAEPLDALLVPRFFGSNADAIIYEDISTFLGTMPEGGSPPHGVPAK